VLEVAASLGVTPAQVALAWVHARTEVWGIGVVPIPGTKRVRWLEDNVAALGVVIPDEARARLDALGGQAVGDRHPQIGLTSAGGRA
jgi:aryl-alcohol dehydrogenase-like predicted oxidoreductase